jgi:hypothetical protein
MPVQTPRIALPERIIDSGSNELFSLVHVVVDYSNRYIIGVRIGADGVCFTIGIVAGKQVKAGIQFISRLEIPAVEVVLVRIVHVPAGILKLCEDLLGESQIVCGKTDRIGEPVDVVRRPSADDNILLTVEGKVSPRLSGPSAGVKSNRPPYTPPLKSRERILLPAWVNLPKPFPR